MSPKKRQLYQCAGHPDKQAYHKCGKCGKRLCGACAMIVRGDAYCFDPACRPDELKTPEPEGAHGVLAIWKLLDPVWHGPMLGATVTIVLCGIVFAAWGLREVSNIYRENTMLRASRLSLIEQLKNSNRAFSPRDTSVASVADSLLNPRAAAAETGATKSAAPPPRQSGPIPWHIANGPTGHRAVSLTFDGSSFANATEAILDTLSSRDATATMFLTGEFIRKYPALTRRIVDAGHECGNHTVGHPHLTTYGADRTSTTLPSVNAHFLVAELRRADALFFSVTNRHMAPLWRAPYGEFNRDICRWAYEAGYLHIGWRQGKTWREGLDSNDWIPDEETDGFHTPDEFLDKVVALSRSQPDGISGGILLFHLGTQRKNPDTQIHRVLGTVIDTLRAGGYRIVPVSEMIAQAGVDLASMVERSHIQ